MLGGKISHQDEDEVEDELAALEAEIKGIEQLPQVPETLPEPQKSEELPQILQNEPEPERQAILA